MTKPKLLIIEDERSLQEVLSYNLVKEGFEVIVASDGQDGLRRVQSQQPDLVILDLMLPVIDGLEVRRTARRHFNSMNRTQTGLPTLTLTSVGVSSPVV